MQKLKHHSKAALLSVEQMKDADSAMIAIGIPGYALMQKAGEAVATTIMAHYSPCNVLVLAGSGNNGGDGFVAAQTLREAGWPVHVACTVERASLSVDVLRAAKDYEGEVVPFTLAAFDNAQLVVDALFGAGLSRDVAGLNEQMLLKAEALNLPIIAVDVPSGVCGNTGAVKGFAATAQHTVTFFRKKIGHLLLPGRSRCGQVTVADIGIKESVLKMNDLNFFQNTPGLWLHLLPRPSAQTHKYDRGHTLVVGGSIERSGAAKLAAYAALRVGSGLVSIASGAAALPVYASFMAALMVELVPSAAEFSALLADRRKNTVLIGPGAGVNEDTKQKVLASLSAGKMTVLDADALAVFEGNAKELFSAIAGTVVLTPHEGEFERLFSGLVDMQQDKLARARAAAAISNAVVVLKGADTVIASPEGVAIINNNAPPVLATAGTGDVLAGMISGLLAQGMPSLEAAAAAVWMHGAAAIQCGPGMIADDLPERLPEIVSYLLYTESNTTDNA